MLIWNLVHKRETAKINKPKSEKGHSKYIIVLLEHLVLTLSSLHMFSNTYLCNNQMLSIPAALVNFLWTGVICTSSVKYTWQREEREETINSQNWSLTAVRPSGSVTDQCLVWELSCWFTWDSFHSSEQNQKYLIKGSKS